MTETKSEGKGRNVVEGKGLVWCGGLDNNSMSGRKGGGSGVHRRVARRCLSNARPAQLLMVRLIIDFILFSMNFASKI